MSLLEINYDNARSIVLKYFYQCVTYGDLLIGSPNRRVNDYTIGLLKRSASMVMGNQRIIILPAELKGDNHSNEHLPPITCFGSFQIYDHGSSPDWRVTLIWMEEDPSVHLSERNIESIKQLPWSSFT